MISSSPKTDQNIIACFKKAKVLVFFLMSVLVCGAVVFACWKPLGHTFDKWPWEEFGDLSSFENIKTNWKKMIFVSGSLGGGFFLVLGLAYNVISIIGLSRACKCLATCQDSKTSIFVDGARKMKKVLIADSLLFWLPPVRFITTLAYYHFARGQRRLIKRLESEVKKQPGIYHKKCPLVIIRDEDDL